MALPCSTWQIKKYLLLSLSLSTLGQSFVKFWMAHIDWLNDSNWFTSWAPTRFKLACAFLLRLKCLLLKWPYFLLFFCFWQINSLVSELIDLGLWLVPHVLGSGPAAFHIFGHLPILATNQLMLSSEKQLVRNAWSCKLNKEMSLDRMLVVSLWYLHRSSSFCTWMYHSSTIDQA